MDESKVKEIIAQNNQDLLSMINYLVSTSISDLKRSSDSNAAEQMSEIKRLKRDDPQSFKKKSNEQQFKVNISILAAVEDASVALDRKDLQKSKEALERGLSLLKDRQKLILLADKSPEGWKTVLEHKHHDLADDDEDEKKNYRAEARAARASKRFTARGLGLQSRPVLPHQPVSGNSQLAAAQLRGLFTQVNLQSSFTDLPAFVFRVGSQITGELLVQTFFFFFCKSSQSAGQVSFSLGSAPYLFPKLLKPLVKKWRSEGKPVVVFLDVSLGAAFSKETSLIAFYIFSSRL